VYIQVIDTVNKLPDSLQELGDELLGKYVQSFHGHFCFHHLLVVQQLLEILRVAKE
jgi:hypothetical protein